MSISKAPIISKFGLISGVLFLLFSLIGRFLFPWGDEPDFGLRTVNMLNHDSAFWRNPYFIFNDLIQNISGDESIHCRLPRQLMSIFVSIDPITCTEKLEQILARYFIIVITTLPLLFAIIFRRAFIYVVGAINFKLTTVEWGNRLDALSLTLIFPSIIYYLGVFSLEQSVLILSLLVFLFWGFRVFMIGLLALIAFVDSGNFVVVFTFIVFSVSFIILAKKCSTKTSFLAMFSVILFAYISDYSVLIYVEQVYLISDIATSMLSKVMHLQHINSNLLEKYPIYLRPIITFMSGTFMTPSGIKVIPIYIIFSVFFVTLIFKLKRLYIISYREKFMNNIAFNIVQTKIILLASTVTLILFFVFLFPDYSFAKYYVFIIPFIFSTALIVYMKSNILIIIIISNLIVFLNLILFRL